MAAAWSRIASISSSEKRTLKYFNKTFFPTVLINTLALLRVMNHPCYCQKSRPLQIPWLLFYFSVHVTATTQLIRLKQVSDAMFLFSL